MLDRDISFPDPPTQQTLAQARLKLQGQQDSAAELTARIVHAEEELDRIVRESTCAITNLQKERTAVESEIARTLAYLSPIRRLPQELLAQIYSFIFEDYPCCAWVLAAVCASWRRQVLAMPRLWSKIRLVTTQSASPDTVRLWLERSGTTVPLDIEIFLHTSQPSAEGSSCPARRRASAGAISPGWATPNWADWVPGSPDDHGHGHGHGGGGYVHVHGGALHYVPLVVPQPNEPPQLGMGVGLGGHDHIGGHGLGAPSGSWRQSRSRGSGVHWGHIAFFYLMEQMHRWERFVFRFDRQFGSINAIKTIANDAPILREFEVSCAEPTMFGHDWTWLPCATSQYDLSQLTSLTLQHVPFKWSSPIFRNLRSLSLRTPPAYSLALDRILHVVKSNPDLESLSLHFTAVNPPVLPLVPITLENLKHFNVGGHFLLVSLVDSLSLPSLSTLIFDVDTRDAMEDTITSLFARSTHPPLVKLSLAYSSNSGASGIFYGPGAMVTSWQFLGDLEELETLQVGASALEPLVSLLGAPDEDTTDPWICPNLRTLALKNCRAHGDGVAKLVQMVEARNPDNGAGNTGGNPVRCLKHLELVDCGLGSDVVRWLDERIDEVVCMEPVDARSPRTPTFHYIG